MELPGDRLERAEQPSACVVREVREELGLLVRAEALLDSWNCEVLPQQYVLILTYACVAANSAPTLLRVSTEHREARLFYPTEIESLRISVSYLRSIRAWCAQNMAGSVTPDA